MKINVLIFMILIIGILNLSSMYLVTDAYASDQNLENWRSYKSEEYNFEIRYPPNFMSANRDLVFTQHHVLIQPKYSNPILRISVFNNPHKYSENEWIARTIDAGRARKNINVANHKGAKYESRGSFIVIPEQVTHIIKIFLQKYDKMYCIEYEYFNNDEEKISLFNSILSSFKFLK